MPSRKQRGGKRQKRRGPVSSPLADALPQCGLGLDECRSSHSPTPTSLFSHLHPTVVLLNSASAYFRNPLSVLLHSSSTHPVVAGVRQFHMQTLVGAVKPWMFHLYQLTRPILRVLNSLGARCEKVHRYIYDFIHLFARVCEFKRSLLFSGDHLWPLSPSTCWQ